jgi:probable F420-dependent oxidoreductase
VTALGRVGIWTSRLGFGSTDEVKASVQEVERAGFGSIWLPESTWVDPLVASGLVLAATGQITVATGIARVHGRAAQTMANAWSGLSAWYPDRFVLGLGVSHEPAVQGLLGQPYLTPRKTMAAYLDELDRAPFHGLAPDGKRRVLAALGPKMLALAAERADGAHPYMAPVEHTRYARGVLGDDRWLVPEVKVLFESDPSTARALVRRQVGPTLALPNYARNIERFGYSADDIANAADPVLDAIVAWGTDDQVATRIDEHVEAGADQVAVQVLTTHGRVPSEEWRRLAQALR